MKNNWQKIILVVYFILLPVISFAEITVVPCETSGKICNPLSGSSDLPSLIKTILTGALKIGIPIVALAIIYCGFLFVAARGNPEELTKAKDALLYTLIGAGILLGALAIAQIIASTILSIN